MDPHSGRDSSRRDRWRRTGASCLRACSHTLGVDREGGMDDAHGTAQQRVLSRRVSTWSAKSAT